MKEALKGKWLIFFAFVINCIGLWGNNINQACLNEIYTEFSNSSEAIRGYIVGGTGMISLAASVLAGILARYISKKHLILGAVLIRIISAVLAVTAPTMAVYAVSRTLFAVSSGLYGVALFSLMFEVFSTPEHSAKIMGAYQTVNTLCGALISYLAGILCTISWRTAQWIGMAAVIPFIVGIFLLPKTPPERAAKAKAADKSSAEQSTETAKTDWSRFALTVLEMVLFYILIMVVQYFISLYLAERQIGDASLAGLLLSLTTLTGAVANIFFGKLFEKLHRYTGVLLILLFSVFSILMGFDIPVWAVIAAVAVNGLTCGVLFSYYPLALNQYVAPGQRTFAQSAFQVFMWLAMALASYTPQFFMGLFGGGYQRMMLTSGITMAGIAIVSILVIRVYVNKRPALHQ